MKKKTESWVRPTGNSLNFSCRVNNLVHRFYSYRPGQNSQQGLKSLLTPQLKIGRDIHAKIRDRRLQGMAVILAASKYPRIYEKTGTRTPGGNGPFPLPRRRIMLHLSAVSNISNGVHCHCEEVA